MFLTSAAGAAAFLDASAFRGAASAFLDASLFFATSAIVVIDVAASRRGLGAVGAVSIESQRMMVAGRRWS